MRVLKPSQGCTWASRCQPQSNNYRHRQPMKPACSITEDDRQHMRHALDLARRGEGKTHPNPAVGCVILKGQQARLQQVAQSHYCANVELEMHACPRTAQCDDDAPFRGEPGRHYHCQRSCICICTGHRGGFPSPGRQAACGGVCAAGCGTSSTRGYGLRDTGALQPLWADATMQQSACCRRRQSGANCFAAAPLGCRCSMLQRRSCHQFAECVACRW